MPMTSNINQEQTRSGEDDGYALQRDSSATTRLNYQYYLWQDTFQFLLHPEIPDLRADARIADVCTGSGIWLFDLSRKVPSSTNLYGIDISLDQIGPQASTIPNLQLRKWNVYESPPADLLGTFDVVHVRLVAIIVINNDPERILENVKLLLKPGGYLQWEEYYTAKACVYSHGEPMVEATSTFSGTARLRELLSSSFHSTNGQKLLGSRDWIVDLPSLMLDQGFVEARHFVYDDAPHMGMFFTEMYVESVAEFASQMLESDPKLAQELRETAKKVYKETRDGAWLLMPKAAFLGRWRA